METSAAVWGRTTMAREPTRIPTRQTTFIPSRVHELSTVPSTYHFGLCFRDSSDEGWTNHNLARLRAAQIDIDACQTAIEPLLLMTEHEVVLRLSGLTSYASVSVVAPRFNWKP